MATATVKHVAVETFEDIPVVPVRGVLYFVKNPPAIYLDAGKGLKQYPPERVVNTLEGEETDKAPSVAAVKAAIAAAAGGVEAALDAINGEVVT
jgi:hypothetical protein